MPAGNFREDGTCFYPFPTGGAVSCWLLRSINMYNRLLDCGTIAYKVLSKLDVTLERKNG